jgi:hypothetical protein
MADANSTSGQGVTTELVKKVAMLEKQVRQMGDENEYLIEKLAELTNENGSLKARLEAMELKAGVKTAEVNPDAVPEELLTVGKMDFVEREVCALQQWHKANIVCVRIHPTVPSLVVSGGVDKTVRIAEWNAEGTGVQLGSVALSAPVLSVDFIVNASKQQGLHPILALASCMDGSHYVLSLDREMEGADNSMKISQSFKVGAQSFHDYSKQIAW